LKQEAAKSFSSVNNSQLRAIVFQLMIQKFKSFGMSLGTATIDALSRFRKLDVWIWCLIKIPR